MAKHTKQRKQVVRLIAKMRALANGLQTNGHTLPPMQYLGQPMTVAQALAKLQGSLAAADLVDDTKKALTVNLAARDATVTADQPTLRLLSLSLSNSLGSSNPQLDLYGVQRDKPRRKRTGAEEAVSAALRRQTRQVRGTLGKKQLAAITLAGKPGLIVVDPTGKPIPGSGLAPVAPGKKPTK